MGKSRSGPSATWAAGSADGRRSGSGELEGFSLGSHTEEDLRGAAVDHNAGTDQVCDEKTTVAVYEVI